MWSKVECNLLTGLCKNCLLGIGCHAMKLKCWKSLTHEISSSPVRLTPYLNLQTGTLSFRKVHKQDWWHWEADTIKERGQVAQEPIRTSSDPVWAALSHFRTRIDWQGCPQQCVDLKTHVCICVQKSILSCSIWNQMSLNINCQRPGYK